MLLAGCALQAANAYPGARHHARGRRLQQEGPLAVRVQRRQVRAALVPATALARRAEPVCVDPLFSPPGNTRPPLDSNVAFSPAASAAFTTACVQSSNLARGCACYKDASGSWLIIRSRVSLGSVAFVNAVPTKKDEIPCFRNLVTS